MDGVESKLAPSTMRWRAWKARQSKGEIILDVPVSHALVELMLDQGVVDEASSRNREALARAVLNLTTNALARSAEKPPKIRK